MTKLMWVCGGLIAAAVCCWTAAAQPYAADAGAGGSSRELVTHFQDHAAGPTVITVVDPQTRVLAVYHVSRDTGEIKLKGVRPFAWDLQITGGYNSDNPSPDDIRKGLDRQQ